MTPAAKKRQQRQSQQVTFTDMSDEQLLAWQDKQAALPEAEPTPIVSPYDDRITRLEEAVGIEPAEPAKATPSKAAPSKAAPSPAKRTTRAKK